MRRRAVVREELCFERVVTGEKQAAPWPVTSGSPSLAALPFYFCSFFGGRLGGHTGSTQGILLVVLEDPMQGIELSQHVCLVSQSCCSVL